MKRVQIGEADACNGFWIKQFKVDFEADQGTATRVEFEISSSIPNTTNTTPVKTCPTMDEARMWCESQPPPESANLMV